MGSLVFIDTNILLDFYRAKSPDVSLSILKRFDGNYDRIITTKQVQMEYKKNRQRVIINSINSIKLPDLDVVPAFLRESKANTTMQGARKTLKKQSDYLKNRTEKLLQDPGRNDPVYKVLQRLFQTKGPCNLAFCDSTTENEINERAQTRFLHGYPPRKNSDISFGDAINWEWIIHCANKCTDDIVIVSRDTDYGESHNGEVFINDWLRQEFKDRVGRRRSISLTNKLTEGFKQAAIEVSKAEEDAEKKFVIDLRENPQLPLFPDEFTKVLEHFRKMVATRDLRSHDNDA